MRSRKVEKHSSKEVNKICDVNSLAAPKNQETLQENTLRECLEVTKHSGSI